MVRWMESQLQASAQGSRGDSEDSERLGLAQLRACRAAAVGGGGWSCGGNAGALPCNHRDFRAAADWPEIRPLGCCRRLDLRAHSRAQQDVRLHSSGSRLHQETHGPSKAAGPKRDEWRRGGQAPNRGAAAGGGCGKGAQCRKRAGRPAPAPLNAHACRRPPARSGRTSSVARVVVLWMLEHAHVRRCISYLFDSELGCCTCGVIQQSGQGKLLASATVAQRARVARRLGCDTLLSFPESACTHTCTLDAS